MAAIVLGLSSCSLLISTAGLAGPAETTAPGDADAAPSDGSWDGLGDADVSPADTGTVGRFCPGSGHAFCADFDGPEADPLALWTQGGPATLPAIVQRTTTRFASSPAALLATNPRLSAGQTRYATVSQSFEGPWRRAIVDFDVFVETPSFQAGDSDCGFVALNFFSNGANQGATLGVGAAETVLGMTSSASNYQGASAAAMTYGEWAHVHLDVTPGGAVAATVGARTYSGTLPKLSAGGQPRVAIEVGILGYNSPAPAFAFYFDNVTIDLP